ncbi:MAG TPA: adenylate/guanylate cyclase domain-containing protein [Actinomycetota bacterium]|nr:adenylate/guanylate cyclase domain-containing protein [Actinomycetota bacterium]
MERPETRYAKTTDGVHIAYQVCGDGELDLLFVPGFASNLIWNWELPAYANFLRRLSSFCRLIIIDRRGSGLSDRLSPEDLPPLEVLAGDLGVVLDAVGSERTSLFGAEDGGLSCSLFAATRPDRVDRLILYTLDPGGDKPWEGAWGREQWEGFISRVADHWGMRGFGRDDPAGGLVTAAPSFVDDTQLLDWHVAMMQLAASPRAVEALFRIHMETDVQPVLTSIRVPTLILHPLGDLLEPIAEGRLLAHLITGAELVELPGDDHFWFLSNTDRIVDAIAEFVTGVRPVRDLDRVLATVLFTDIVGSTEMAARLGDAGWKGLLASHDERARTEIQRHRGTYIDSTGDGLLATFDGPARAVRCARAIGGAVRELGLEIRSGVHTGEIEVAGNNVRGIAVHIGARVAALADPGQVLVSSTVKDLVAGSGLTFEDAGEHDLKGVPDRRHLFRVVE